MKIQTTSSVALGVFTKPWRDLSIDELMKMVSELGLQGVEFPVRPGFQVEPDRAESGLLELTTIGQKYGVRVLSVAADPTEVLLASCAAAKIPVVRVMADLHSSGYLLSWKEFAARLDQWTRWAERFGVQIGVQPHHSNLIADSAELYTMLKDRDPRYVGAIWDAAHDAITGREPEVGLELVWSHLIMVNLKNAYYRRVSGPEADQSEWQRYFTTGPHGLASWPRIIAYLQERQYHGPICLTAEYTAKELVDPLVTRDVHYVKQLMAAVGIREEAFA